MADMFPPPQTPCWELKTARMQTLQPLTALLIINVFILRFISYTLQ